MKRFKVVVAGTGFIGPIHVEALRRLGIDVVAFVGSTKERSRQNSSALGLRGGYDSLEDVLQDPAIDAVHLATPNWLHYSGAKAVIEAGKHCMCEKPLAIRSAESAELVELARSRNVAAAVAHNIRFYPLCHEAAARVHSGSIGNVLHVVGSYVQDWLLYPTDYNWRVCDVDGGPLRAVADIGTHWMDLIQFITGQSIVSVCADLRIIHPTRYRPIGGSQTFSSTGAQGSANVEAVSINTEDCGSILFQLSNGVTGNLWVSQTTAGRKNCLRFEIGGSEASLSWNSEAPNSLWIGHRHRAAECLTRDPSLMSAQAAAISNYPGGHNEGFPDTFKQLFRSFYEYIAVGDLEAAPTFPTFSDGHSEILLCEAILRSHQLRKWVDL